MRLAARAARPLWVPRRVRRVFQASSSSGPTSPHTRKLQQQPPSTMASLPDAINSFGESLFQVLQPHPGPGVFLSPVCIAQALAMLLNGVEPGGQSFSQLQAAVYGGASGKQLGLEEINSQLQQLSTSITQASDGSNLTVSDANSVWVARQYGLQPTYRAALDKYFGARVESISTAQAVNSWVSEATRGKITSIIDDGALQRAACVLINALYFKGLWKSPFKGSDTGPVPFNYLQGPRKDVAMMFQTFKANNQDIQVARFQAALPGAAPSQVLTTAAGGASYGLGGAGAGAGSVPCIAVRLPYQGGDFAAVVAMPEGNLTSDEGAPLVLDSGASYAAALAGCRAALLSGLGDASALTSAHGGQAAPKLQWQAPGMQVKLWMPRFEIEFETSLTQALQSLGVTKPFTGGDITRIAATPEGTPVGDLVVSDVIHKVYIKADEAGTEAAAVTAAVMLRAMIREPPALELRLDRPFAFAVLHETSGAALFVGEVHEPEDWGA